MGEPGGKGHSTFRVVCITVTVNVLLLVGYHLCFHPVRSVGRIYTSNAREVIDRLYQRAMAGGLDMDMLKSIVSNMETEIRNKVNQEPGAVILVDRAVISGGREIYFGQNGFVVTDPEAIRKIKSARKEPSGGTEPPGAQTLHSAIQELMSETEKLTGER